MYQFESNQTEDIKEFKETLDKVIEKITYYDLSTSIDVYNKDKTFLVVHGIKSIDGAKGFADIVEEKDKKKIARPFFGISQENYQIIQIHKNLDTYIANQ